MNGLDARYEEGFGEHHEDLVRTVAERHLADVDRVPLRGARAQAVAAAVGIMADVRDRRRERRARMPSRTERVLVRRELDAAADAEFALERLRRLAGHVRGQAAQPRSGKRHEAV